MSTKDTARALLAIAQDQVGYFTARQALSAGYSYKSQHYHASTGDWTRVARGLYRLWNFPAQPREDLIVLTLLSSNRVGEPQATVSHETALVVHAISDANPAKIHLTVPPGFRKPMPAFVVLHRANLTAQDWEDRGGYRVTTVLRTISDIASDPISWPFLDGAIRDALREGLVRRKQLLAADGTDDVKARIGSALRATESGGSRGTSNAVTRASGHEMFRTTWHTPPREIQESSSSSTALAKQD